MKTALVQNKLLAKVQALFDGNSLVGKTIRLSVISLFANFLSLVVPIYIAYEYGVSSETDDFFLSYGIITFIGVAFSGAVRAVSVPFLRERLADKSAFDEFVSSVLVYCLIFLGAGCVLMAAFSYGALVILDKPVFWYLFLASPIVLFTVVNAFCYGILNSKDQFYLAELSPLSRSIVIFICIFALKQSFGIAAVVIGYLLGEAGKTLHLLIVLAKNDVKFSLKKYNRNAIQQFLKQGSFQILSTTLSAAAPLTNKVVAAFLVAGSISILDYGDKLFMIFNVLLNSFLALILPKWSSSFSDKSFQIKNLYSLSRTIFIITTIVFIAVLVAQAPLVRLLYPNVGTIEQETIGLVLSLYMGGFIFNAVAQLINRATIAMKATRIMMTTSIIRTVSNIGLNILFASMFGVIGIAISSLLVQIIALPVTYILFKKQYDNLKYEN